MPHKVKIQLLDDVDASAIGNLKILQFDSTSGKHKYVATTAVAGGITGFATPNLTLGTTNAGGAATTAIRSDATILVFDSTNPVTQALGDSASPGSGTIAAYRNHKHAVTNPLTTKGDIIVGGTSGAITRLGVGSDTQVLTADSAQPLGVKWATPASGFADPTTTKGDIIVHGSSTTRMAVGTDGQVLTADSAQTLGVKWATPSSGFSDPTTTKGDLIVHGSSTTRLGVGTDGQVLTADSSQTLGVKWATPHFAQVHLASAQTINDNTDTVVKFDTKDSDPDTAYSTSTGLYTCPVAGTYAVSGCVAFSGDIAAGKRTANSIQKNGSSVGRTANQLSGQRYLPFAATVRCAANDTLAVGIYQNTGASTTTATGGVDCQATFYLIGT